MKKVYLAGAITGRPDPDIFDWRDVTTRELAALGVGVVDPARMHMAGPGSARQWEEKNADYRRIVDSDLAEVRSCDALLANCNWPSWGTAMEIMTAHYTGRPVFLFKSDRVPTYLVRELNKEECTTSFATMPSGPWSAFLLAHCLGHYDGRNEAVRNLIEFLAGK